MLIPVADKRLKNRQQRNRRRLRFENPRAQAKAENIILIRKPLDFVGVEAAFRPDQQRARPRWGGFLS